MMFVAKEMKLDMASCHTQQLLDAAASANSDLTEYPNPDLTQVSSVGGWWKISANRPMVARSKADP